MGDLCGRCLSFIVHLKDATWKEQVRLLAIVQEEILWAHPDSDSTRVIEKSTEIKHENINWAFLLIIITSSAL